MSRSAPFSLRLDNPGVTLIGGAILVILGIAALLAVERWWDRAQRLETAQREAGNLAEIMMEHTRQSIEAADQALQGLATSIDSAQLGNTAVQDETDGLLQRRAEATRGVYQFLIINPQGAVLHSSFPKPAESLVLSASPEVQGVADLTNTELFISSPFMARYGPAENKRVFLLIRRLSGPNGGTAAYIQATYSIDWLENFARALKVGAHGAVGLIHMDGTVMARTPQGESYFGRNYAGTSFFSTVTANPKAGIVRSEPTTDRGARYTAYRQIPGTPIVVYVIGDLSDILAPWWRGVVIQAIGLVAFATILLVATLTVRAGIQREIKTQSTYAERLERLAAAFGDLFAIRNRDALLKRVTDVTRDLIPSHQAIISFNSNADFAQTIHAASLSDKYAAWKDYAETPDGSGIYRIVAETNQVMRMTQAELESHPAWRGFGSAKDRHPPMRGWLAAPLRNSTGKNFGLLQLSDRAEGDYDAADEAILVQIANVVSIALDSLRLSDEAVELAAQTAHVNTKIAGVMASMSDGVAVLDSEWRYTFINDRFTEITGLTRNDTIGTTVWKVLGDRPNLSETAKLNAGYLRRCMETRQPVEFEDSITPAPGQSRKIEIRAVPTEDGLTTYLRDVTARRDAENRLLQAQKMDAVGQLTGGVAHDFNNLLTVIIGNADILSDLLGSNPGPALRSANLIMGAARRASDLIKRLLAFARRQPLAPRTTKIKALVSELESLLRRTLNENIDMEIIQADNLWSANIDPVQLENSLLNLVINARDAMPRGGKLTLETSNTDLDESYAKQADIAPGQYVMVALTDTGTGMPPDVLAKAFDPFFTTKEPGRGTGLGLSMVFGYVKQSGGHVRIYSEVGIGTTVKIFLPRSQDDSVSNPAEAVAASIPKGSETVLMVEDEDMVREFVAATLDDLGYKVKACGNAAEALAAIDAGFAPDILLTDVVLAGMMNGRQLAEAMTQRLPKIAVLYMSGYTEDAIVHQGRLDPGVHLISKPFRRQQLAEKLRRVVEQRAKSAASAA
ncbi:MAG: response regulator [Rhodospirillaceae bacterium]|nr:response regulator [Rhodospirillaceae bacterium]